MSYNRENAVKYALKWAMDRNPTYYNFDDLGGDCTNFVSQCVFSGGIPMNFAGLGWYYNNLNDRSPSWTSVEAFYDYMTKNENAKEVSIKDVEMGDIFQLSFDGIKFSHAGIIVKESPFHSVNSTLICAHTFDAKNRPIGSYIFKSIRFIKFI